LHDLAIAVSPALEFTAEEVWQHHSALQREAESVHYALFADPADVDSDEGDWELLLEVRDAVNAVIEPLRAAKTVTTTMEVDVVIQPRADHVRVVETYREELAGFLMVAKVDIDPNSFRATDQDEAGAATLYRVRATPTAYRKCDRCWTYRADVETSVNDSAVCGRCAGVLDRARESAT